MNRRIRVPDFLVVLAALAWTAAPAATGDLWLHVRVEEAGESAEKVNVNIPLSLVEEILPAIESHELHGGKVRVDADEFEGTDLRAVWEAIRKTRDAEFVTVESPDENVRVAKEGNFLVVHATDRGDEAETVDVRIPLSVVDALFSAGPGELDVLAAIRALGEHAGGDLVTVRSSDANVRVWIDTDQAGR